MLYEPIKKCKIGYVKILENESTSFLDRIKYWFKYNFKMIGIKKAEGNIIYEIPLYMDKIIKKKVDKILDKLKLEIKKENVEALVLSEEIKNILNQTNMEIPIINGKYLMKNLLIDILDKILKLHDQKILASRIYILVEKYNKENLDIIYDISSKVRSVSIVTKNIKNFKNVEDKLLNNFGVAISVGNNRKKGLKNAEIIINFDYNLDEIQKYNIKRDAIIINCADGKLDLQNGFSGVIINGINIDEKVETLQYFKIYDIFEKFNKTELYESLIFNKFYDKITRQKDKDNISIKHFVGGRGVINMKEIENSQIT